MITRRSVLAAGAAFVLAPAAARAARGELTGDAELLREAVELEQLASAAYVAAAAAGTLAPASAELAETLAGHESQHADVLAVQLEALGGARPAPPAGLPAADALAERLQLQPLSGALESDRSFLRWAHATELRQIGGYVEAARRALDVGLVQTLASILAAEGQHLAAVREALGRAPTGPAFEAGG